MNLLGIPVLLAGWVLAAFDGTASLKDQLSRKGAGALARAAMSQGDARRGAIVFYQPQLLCATCHIDDKSGAGLGPPLTAPGKSIAGAEIVEAILEPSKTIRKGYETVVIVTKQGKTLTGRLLEERPDVVVLREGDPAGKSIIIARADIDERNDKGPSLMPEGLVNLLGSRQEFLDLVRYLIEVGERGPARALELRPDPAAIGRVALPEYENNLDHAGLIAGFDSLSFRRGQKIYERVCATVTAPRTGPAHCRRRSGSHRVRSRMGLTLFGCIKLSLAASARCRRRPGWCRGRNMT